MSLLRRACLAFLPVFLALGAASPVWGARHEGPKDAPAVQAKPKPAPGGALEIRGRVFNKTLARPGPAGLQVRLLTVEGSDIRLLGTATTDAAGKFAFPGVKPPEAGKGHLLAATQYKGVPYLALVSPGGAEGQLFIFELTRDPKGVRVEAHQLLVRYEEGRLVFREVVRLANTGTATYAAEKGDTLAFHLPAGAELLEPPSGLNPQGVRVRSGQVISSDPLPPGLRQVVLVYAIADPPAQVPVETRFRFPTGRFEVMTPEFGMRQPVSSDLKYEGVFGEDLGNRVHLAAKSDLPAGARVRFTLSRDVASPFAENLFFALAAVVILGLAVPFALRRRRLARARAEEGERRAKGKGPAGASAPSTSPAPQAAQPPSGQPARRLRSEGTSKGAPGRAAAADGRTSDLLRERSEVLAQIAALDDDLEAGRIAKGPHESRRSELMRRALEVSKQIGEP